MSSLSQAQLAPVDPVLTEHAGRIGPGHMKAEVIAPTLNVKEETGQIVVWDSTNLEVPTDTYRAIGAEASEAADPEPSYRDYTCAVHARKILCTQRELRKADAQGMGADKLKRNKVKKLVDQFNLIRERALATKLTTSANYDTSHSVAIGSGSEFDTDAGDPMGVIETGLQQGADAGIYYSHAIIPYKVWVTLSRHSDLVDLTKHTYRGKITEDGFIDIFNLKPIICASVYHTGSAKAQVWGDNMILGYLSEGGVDMHDDGTEPLLARTITCQPYSVVEYDARNRDHKGATYIEVEHGYTAEWICVDNATDGDSLGYLITNCLS